MVDYKSIMMPHFKYDSMLILNGIKITVQIFHSPKESVTFALKYCEIPVRFLVLTGGVGSTASINTNWDMKLPQVKDLDVNLIVNHTRSVGEQ